MLNQFYVEKSLPFVGQLHDVSRKRAREEFVKAGTEIKLGSVCIYKNKRQIL